MTPDAALAGPLAAIEILVSEEFDAALSGFSRTEQAQVAHKVRLLCENPAHPSLKAHRIRNHEGKWECYVNAGDRIIYERDGQRLLLWKLGPHELVERLHFASFAAHTTFRHPGWLPQEVPGAEEVAGAAMPAPAATAPVGGSANPFQYFSVTHLRLLGVPAAQVKEVQKAASAEALDAILGLPDHALLNLQELLTNPDLAPVAFDPGRLLFRTTLDRLEGYAKGAIRQLMLNLTPDQRQYVDPPLPGTWVLKGVAGSGKTTVGIYRAIRLAGEGRRVLLLAYNRTLNAVTHSLVQSLIGDLPANLVVVNIDRWVHEFLQGRGGPSLQVNEERCRAILDEVVAEARLHGREAVLQQPNAFFWDEIARVIKGNGFTEWEQYRGVPRHGRRSALGEAQRTAVWRIYAAYRERCQQEGVADWRDPALAAYQALLQQPLEAPYDDVIVDEGQDLTAVQLRVAQRLIRGGDPNRAPSLLILGDAAQTIYSRGFSWQQAGIQAQGRTYILRKNHRNTKQVAETGAALLTANRMLTASEDYIAPEWTQRSGPWPAIIECDSADRELRAVREQILDLVGDGRFRLSDFAIICPTVDLCDRVRADLLTAGLPCAHYRDEAFDVLEEQVKVLTVQSAKGLEFPVVFVVGVREGILPRRPPLRLESEERDLELERQRILLYVAITRAAEALWLVTNAGARSGFLGELGPHVRTQLFPSGGARI